MLSRLKKQKQLGVGSVGKVYQVDKGGQTFALKVEYILEKGDELCNELRFVDEVASRYPDKFIQLVDYEIVENCHEKLSKINRFLPKGLQHHLEMARRGRICVYKLYTMIDRTLASVLPHMTRWSMAHRYSLLLQLIDILRVMDIHGWVHGDFHPGNVGVVNAYRTLHLGRYRVKSYGTVLQSIDFDGVLREDGARADRPYQGDDTETEREHFLTHLWTDRMMMLSVMIDEQPYWDYVQTHSVPLDYETDLARVKKLKAFRLLRRDKRMARLPDDVIFRLVHLMYPVEFQTAVLGAHFRHVIPLPLRYPLDDVLYVFLHFFENDKLLRYFYTRYSREKNKKLKE